MSDMVVRCMNKQGQNLQGRGTNPSTLLSLKQLVGKNSLERVQGTIMGKKKGEKNSPLKNCTALLLFRCEKTVHVRVKILPNII